MVLSKPWVCKSWFSFIVVAVFAVVVVYVVDIIIVAGNTSFHNTFVFVTVAAKECVCVFIVLKVPLRPCGLSNLE